MQYSPLLCCATLRAYVELEGGARAIQYSPDGAKLAIGIGGTFGNRTGEGGKARLRKDGTFIILDSRDLSIIHEGRDSREWITDVKYTPDGKPHCCGAGGYMALPLTGCCCCCFAATTMCSLPAGNTLGLASADGKVYIYDIANAYALRGVFDKHSSPVMHFDFSADNSYLQSASEGEELLYADASSGQYLPSASSLKDVEWETVTCPYGMASLPGLLPRHGFPSPVPLFPSLFPGWPMLGLWPTTTTGRNVTTVDRSRSGTLLAVGDNVGQVMLRRFPAVEKAQVDKSYL